MKDQKQPYRKSKTSYINIILSTALVLTILGIIFILFFEANNLSKVLKENIVVQIELKNNMSPALYKAKMNELAKKPYFKKIEFISKEDAALRLQEEMGEKFIDIIGYNPLYNSFNVNVKSEYTEPDKLIQLKAELLRDDLVSDVTYPNLIASSLHHNIRKFSIASFGFSIILLILILLLIDSTIRLAMYSDRFLIKSMQMVGATKAYIIKPYLWVAVRNAVISSLIASLLITLLLLALTSFISGFAIIQNYMAFLGIVGAIFFFGLVISLLSTYFSVKKYLKKKLDDLY